MESMTCERRQAIKAGISLRPLCQFTWGCPAWSLRRIHPVHQRGCPLSRWGSGGGEHDHRGQKMEGKESKRVAAWATNTGAGELPPQRTSSVLKGLFTSRGQMTLLAHCYARLLSLSHSNA